MFYILAFTCGVLINFQLITNSELSKKIGLINATFINFLIATILLFIQKMFIDSVLDFTNFKEIPLIIFAGGFIGVIITVTSNYIIPKLPLIYSTIFTFFGQMLASIFIDYFMDYRFNTYKIIGLILITGGINLVVYFEYKEHIKKLSQGQRV